MEIYSLVSESRQGRGFEFVIGVAAKFLVAKWFRIIAFASKWYLNFSNFVNLDRPGVPTE